MFLNLSLAAALQVLLVAASSWQEVRLQVLCRLRIVSIVVNSVTSLSAAHQIPITLAIRIA